MSGTSDPVLHVVLYQPQIPLNAGSIGRTCVAAGARLWLVRPLGFRLDTARLRRAGLDYWPHLDWRVVDDWSALQSTLAGHRLWLFSTRGKHCYTAAQYLRGDVLVFGCETTGLPDSLLDGHTDQTLRIPMRAAARSLNQANAASIAVYEALRQIERWPNA